MPYEISRGIKRKAIRTLIYGVEGVGKTTLASQFPDPLFIDCEGGSDNLDVKRFPRPTSWAMLCDEVREVLHNPTLCKTLVIDTIDWAETQCVNYIISKANDRSVDSLESYGWGKGYIMLNEEFGRFLNMLNEVRDKGIHVVLTAHMAIRTMTLPEDQGGYDRYELKLKTAKNGNNCQLVKEWADMILFLNYKTFIVEDSKTKKGKATGGKRMMFTERTTTFDAKNRFGLAPELPLSFDSIAHLFEEPKTVEAPQLEPVLSITEMNHVPAMSEEDLKIIGEMPKELADLMLANNVTPAEIQTVTGMKGWFPATMDIRQYPEDFILGGLIAGWNQMFEKIKENRKSSF